MTAVGRLAGKVALVTGGAQGIGEAIARKLAEHGAVVWIGDIQDEKGEAVAGAIGQHFVRLDVTQPSSWEAAVQEIGALDILVNNAGDGCGGPIETTPVADHQRVIDLNLTGVWLGVRACVPALAARDLILKLVRCA